MICRASMSWEPGRHGMQSANLLQALFTHLPVALKTQTGQKLRVSYGRSQQLSRGLEGWAGHEDTLPAGCVEQGPCLPQGTSLWVGTGGRVGRGWKERPLCLAEALIHSWHLSQIEGKQRLMFLRVWFIPFSTPGGKRPLGLSCYLPAVIPNFEDGCLPADLLAICLLPAALILRV
jgi:hypothetical protein